IHSNGIKTHGLAGLVKPRRASVVWHVHDFVGRRPLASRLLRWSARKMAGAIAISKAVAADVRSLWPKIPLRVIANTVDTQEFSPGPQDGALLDRLAGLPFEQDCVRVGLVATYARWKGHEVFLKAAAFLKRLTHVGRRVRFFVVGGPVYQTQGSQFEGEE